jgi:hypothetical protein
MASSVFMVLAIAASNAYASCEGVEVDGTCTGYSTDAKTSGNASTHSSDKAPADKHNK